MRRWISAYTNDGKINFQISVLKNFSILHNSNYFNNQELPVWSLNCLKWPRTAFGRYGSERWTKFTSRTSKWKLISRQCSRCLFRHLFLAWDRPERFLVNTIASFWKVRVDMDPYVMESEQDITASIYGVFTSEKLARGNLTLQLYARDMNKEDDPKQLVWEQEAFSVSLLLLFQCYQIS